MRNRIVGGIAAVWGAGVLISFLVQGGLRGQGEYAAGQIGGLVFGGILLIVGLYYLVKGPGAGQGK